MSESQKPLGRVEVLNLEGERLVVVVPDVRDDFDPWVRRTAKQLSKLVEPTDNVVLAFDPEVFRPADVSEFCRWLWDDAGELLRTLSWQPPAEPPGGFGAVVGAFGAWSLAYGPESPEHRRRRFPVNLETVVRQRLRRENAMACFPDGRVPPKVARLAKRVSRDARQAGALDLVVVVADAMDAEGREVLRTGPPVTEPVVRLSGSVFAATHFPRNDAANLASRLDADFVGLADACPGLEADATFVAGGVLWVVC